jgi:hypothetical protein
VIAASGPLRWWAQGDAAQSCRKAAYSTLRWPAVVCTTQESAWRITASTPASLWAGSRGQPSRRSSRVRIVAASRQKRQQTHQAHPGEQAQFQNGQKAQVHAGQQTNPEQPWDDRAAGPDQQQRRSPLDQLGAAAEQLQQGRKSEQLYGCGPAEDVDVKGKPHR